MIHPNLATMLAVVTTDYPLEPGEADRRSCAPAVDESFNSISVDGECSTNDTVVLLANGAVRRSARATTTRSRPRCSAVCGDLAAQIVADGEGATVVAEIEVTRRRRARPRRRRSPRRIATSPLVKTALLRPRRELGPRPRRRRLGAVQRRLRAARARPGRRLRYNGVRGASRRGTPSGRRARRSATAAAGSSSTSASATGEASYLTSDLSYDYVRINADYRS